MLTTDRLSLDDIPASRQARLEAWLVLKGLRKVDLANRLGLHMSAIGKAMSGERPFGYIIRALIDLGVPEELLPKPIAGGFKRQAAAVAKRLEELKAGQAA